MTHEFDAVITEGRSGGTLVEIPFSVQERYGTRGQRRVLATFDGESYRGSLAPMGGRHVLGIDKAIRANIGKTIGDIVHVAVQRDTALRQVDVPPELRRALTRDLAAAVTFEAMAYTYRKEYARWIADAKRKDTRQRRLNKALEKLRRGERL